MAACNKLFLIVLMFSMMACKPKEAVQSDINAIVSADGTQAFGLIPMRVYWDSEQNKKIPDSNAYIVENALRLTYGAVQCLGKDAAKMMNNLEDIALVDMNFVRHNGRTLVDPSGQPIAQGCSLIGDRLMGGSSFVAIFSQAPRSKEIFESQQTIWLAARGRTGASNKGFSKSFYAFLAETLGAAAVGTQNARQQKIAGIDANYNPCVKEVSKLVHDKNRSFGCKNGNYVVKGQYESTKNAFLGAISAAEKQYDEALARISSTKTAGLALSTNVTTSERSILELSAKIKIKPSGRPEGRPDQISISAGNALLFGDAATVENFFGIILGDQPAPALVSGNPNPGHLPPTTGSKSGFGLTDGEDVGGGFSLADGAATDSAATPATGGTTTPATTSNPTPATTGSTPASTASTGSSGTTSTWSGWEKNSGGQYQGYYTKPDNSKVWYTATGSGDSGYKMTQWNKNDDKWESGNSQFHKKADQGWAAVTGINTGNMATDQRKTIFNDVNSNFGNYYKQGATAAVNNDNKVVFQNEQEGFKSNIGTGFKSMYTPDGGNWFRAADIAYKQNEGGDGYSAVKEPFRVFSPVQRSTQQNGKTIVQGRVDNEYSIEQFKSADTMNAQYKEGNKTLNGWQVAAYEDPFKVFNRPGTQATASTPQNTASRTPTEAGRPAGFDAGNYYKQQLLTKYQGQLTALQKDEAENAEYGDPSARAEKMNKLQDYIAKVEKAEPKALLDSKINNYVTMRDKYFSEDSGNQQLALKLDREMTEIKNIAGLSDATVAGNGKVIPEQNQFLRAFFSQVNTQSNYGAYGGPGGIE